MLSQVGRVCGCKVKMKLMGPKIGIPAKPKQRDFVETLQFVARLHKCNRYKEILTFCNRLVKSDVRRTQNIVRPNTFKKLFRIENNDVLHFCHN